MQLREEILKEHSKAQCSKIVEWVDHSQERFDQLCKLFLTDEYRVVQRAAWPLSYCAMAHPTLIQKHFGKLIRNLHKPGIHPAVKRNTIRLMQNLNIPAKFHGELMGICFSYIASPDEAVAVKAFSLTILQKLALLYPDILAEIKMVIEERWDHETAAFKSRAAKILKEQG